MSIEGVNDEWDVLLNMICLAHVGKYASVCACERVIHTHVCVSYTRRCVCHTHAGVCVIHTQVCESYTRRCVCHTYAGVCVVTHTQVYGHMHALRVCVIETHMHERARTHTQPRYSAAPVAQAEMEGTGRGGEVGVGHWVGGRACSGGGLELCMSAKMQKEMKWFVHLSLSVSVSVLVSVSA